MPPGDGSDHLMFSNLEGLDRISVLVRACRALPPSQSGLRRVSSGGEGIAKAKAAGKYKRRPVSIDAA
jgi:hypothetical protein